MNEEQRSIFDKIIEDYENLMSEGIDYWARFSNLDTWQFWVNVVFLILPLIVIWFSIDKKRALLLGFYGFNVHVWFTYIDSLGVNFGTWGYPFKAIPLFPVSFALDVSLIPVVYMLVYQWTLNHRKNYYLYLTITSAFFAFIFKPILVWSGLFILLKGFNYFHLFLGYLVIMLVSKWISNIFVHFQRNEPKTSI